MFLYYKSRHAFVVSFESAARECGRVEHVGTGQHVDFVSLEQLLSFLRVTGAGGAALADKPSEAAEALAASERSKWDRDA